jgi:hypothetical protein
LPLVNGAGNKDTSSPGQGGKQNAFSRDISTGQNLDFIFSRTESCAIAKVFGACSWSGSNNGPSDNDITEQFS